MRIKRSKIREAAHMQHCTLRIPDVCNDNPYTTVFAHLDMKGAGTDKRNFPHEPNGVFACHACHDWLDGRNREDGPYQHWINTLEASELREELRRVARERDKLFYERRGLINTIAVRLELGL